MWWKNPELWGLVIQLLVLFSIVGLTIGVVMLTLVE